MRVTIDLPDALIDQVECRMPNAKWSTLIIDALTYCITMADAASSGSQPSDDEADDQPPCRIMINSRSEMVSSTCADSQAIGFYPQDA
jgi:hypothetical protein